MIEISLKILSNTTLAMAKLIKMTMTTIITTIPVIITTAATTI
jgi:hypothetical protein